jgi:hypothetical protein
MRHRLLVASLLLLLALPLIALPAVGQPPPAVATATFTDNGGCSVTVTYTWSGFKGHDLAAQYEVVWPGPTGGTQFGLPFQAFPVTGSGTSSHTFDLTGKGSHTYSGRGHLLTTKGKELIGSDVGSPTSADLSC